MKNNEGFLKHDKMTAKEFLREFSLWIETGGLVEENPNRTEQDWEDQIDSFLEEFHKTYVPITRWIVKGETVHSEPGPGDCPDCGAIAHPGYGCDDYERPLPSVDTCPRCGAQAIPGYELICCCSPDAIQQITDEHTLPLHIRLKPPLDKP